MTARIGIIGAGNILEQYLVTFDGQPEVHVAAVAARGEDRVRAAVGGRELRTCTVPELLDDPALELVVNLTPPAAHVEISRAIIAAGKHLYSEKPLALSVADGAGLLAAAERAGVEVGCAPDTFLGTGLQSTARALRSGWIGEPFAGLAIWGSAGPEPWHPNPQIFYAAGGGPVLDMGPYYLTALVTHLGPVVSVAARNLTTGRRRFVGTGPLAGTPLAVDVPTHATAILEHAGGALSTVVLSFETFGEQRLLEIAGTGGRIRLGDPNRFADRGTILLAADPGREEELADTAGYAGAGRGIGAVELLRAVAAGRKPRASGLLALHVTEVLGAINAGGTTRIETAPVLPDPVELTGG